MSSTIIIAHRGASYDAPENTLHAFTLGYEQDADAVECDVHLTRDGHVVVIHDYDTARTGSLSNNVAVSDLAELRMIDVAQWGKWKERGFSEKVPLLEDVLATIPEGKRLFIEIKCGPEVLPELDRVLKKSGKRPEQTPIIGFGYETVKAAKATMPHLEVSWLVSGNAKSKEYPPLQELIGKAKAAGLDGLDLNFGFPINAEFTRTVHLAGLKLYTWTVNDPAIAAAHVEAGVDGITTDRPKWIREQIPTMKTK